MPDMVVFSCPDTSDFGAAQAVDACHNLAGITYSIDSMWVDSALAICAGNYMLMRTIIGFGCLLAMRLKSVMRSVSGTPYPRPLLVCLMTCSSVAMQTLRLTCPSTRMSAAALSWF